MRFILVLLLLPFLFLFGWGVAPFVWVGGRTIMFVEGMREHIGPWAEYIFFIGMAMLITLCGKSRGFFLLGVLPILLIASFIGRW